MRLASKIILEVFILNLHKILIYLLGQIKTQTDYLQGRFGGIRDAGNISQTQIETLETAEEGIVGRRLIIRSRMLVLVSFQTQTIRDNMFDGR